MIGALSSSVLYFLPFADNFVIMFAFCLNEHVCLYKTLVHRRLMKVKQNLMNGISLESIFFVINE